MFKKALLSTVVLASVACLTPVVALADDHSQDTVTTTTTSTTYTEGIQLAPGYVWVGYRTGPGTKYSVAGKLQQGQTLDYVQTYNGWWYEVDVNSQDYYISCSPSLTELVQVPHTTTTTTTVEAPWKLQADKVVAAAKTQLGVPYLWGHQLPGVGFDCSNFVAWSYKQIGISFSGSSQWQRHNVGTPVTLSDIREGDVLFFATPGDPSGGGHVGIYEGDGMVIQCGGGWKKVTEEPLATTWLGKNLVFARRVIN